VVVTKSMGSSNPVNVVKATIRALSELKDPKQEVARRKAAMAGGEGSRV
jgi:ribosomal protein S5